MSAEILVALKRQDRLSEMIPYIEKVVRPGMRVVFLVRFIANCASKPLFHDSVELECPENSGYEEGEQPRLAAKGIDGTQSMEERRLAAEHKVFLALEALRRKGVEIFVDVYAGSLKKVLKDYLSKGDVHFIVKRLGKLHAIIQSVSGAFKERTFSPILSIYSTHAVLG